MDLPHISLCSKDYTDSIIIAEYALFSINGEG